MRRRLLTAMLITATCCAHSGGTEPASRVVVRFTTQTQGTVTLPVSVADTPTERQRGLSGVTHLTGRGMAFVYARPSMDEFWMKDTLIPLSVAFVGADGIIVAIRVMSPCTSDPCRTYISPSPYRLAIEASPRWFRTHGVATGDPATVAGASP
jgi:uncharacterized protein